MALSNKSQIILSVLCINNLWIDTNAFCKASSIIHKINYTLGIFFYLHWMLTFYSVTFNHFFFFLNLGTNFDGKRRNLLLSIDKGIDVWVGLVKPKNYTPMYYYTTERDTRSYNKLSGELLLKNVAFSMPV